MVVKGGLVVKGCLVVVWWFGVDYGGLVVV